MKLSNNIVLLLLVWTLTGCDQPSYVYDFPETAFVEKAKLSKIGVKRIELDSSLGIANQSLIYYENPEPRISILNTAARKIHILDYASGKQLYVIPLAYQGETGLGNISNMGHYMINEDSIFLTNHWENRVYMINNEGEILAKYNLKDDPEAPSFFLMNNANSQMKLIKNNLFVSLQGSYKPYLTNNYLLKLNLQDSSVSYYIQEPEILRTHFWGPITPFTFSSTFVGDKVVTSFGKNPEIDVYSTSNLSTVLSSHIIGSKFVKSFESFPRRNSKPDSYGYSYNEIAPMTNKKGVFISIDHDPNTGHYIRTMLLPRTQDQYELRLKGTELTYIIIDENFKKIGETKMPRGKYQFDSYLLNKKGLHLINLEDYAKDEDYLTFDIYEISEK